MGGLGGSGGRWIVGSFVRLVVGSVRAWLDCVHALVCGWRTCVGCVRVVRAVRAVLACVREDVLRASS